MDIGGRSGRWGMTVTLVVLSSLGVAETNVRLPHPADLGRVRSGQWPECPFADTRAAAPSDHLQTSDPTPGGGCESSHSNALDS
jgi:hypothetical protein